MDVLFSICCALLLFLNFPLFQTLQRDPFPKILHFKESLKNSFPNALTHTGGPLVDMLAIESGHPHFSRPLSPAMILRNLLPPDTDYELTMTTE